MVALMSPASATMIESSMPLLSFRPAQNHSRRHCGRSGPHPSARTCAGQPADRQDHLHPAICARQETRAPAVVPRHLAHDREPEAGTGRGGTSLAEAVEDLLAQKVGNTGSLVADLDPDMLAVLAY